MLVDALTYSVYDLKATQMSLQLSLIWEFMLYKFELSHNTEEAIKNIRCVKGEGTVDHSTVIK